MHNRIRSILASLKTVMVLIVLISIVVTITGYLLFEIEEKKIIEQKAKTLQAIAELKIKQIQEWYLDELKDAETIADNFLLRKSIEDYLASESQADKEVILHLFNQIKNEHNYYDIILVSPEGKTLASTDIDITFLEPVEINSVRTAVKNKTTTATDLYKSTHNNKILQDFIAPIFNGPGYTGSALIFKFNPEIFLYPLISTWPQPSKTAETFIFRIEGDSLTYLNELRHRENTALNFRLPLTTPHLPAAFAAKGGDGVYRGKDYINNDVLAYVGKIPQTPWYMVCKINEDEVFAELPRLAVLIAVFILLFLIGISLAVAWIYQYRQKNIYKELFDKEKEVWQQQEKFKVTMDSLGEGVITLDINGKIQYMNDRAETTTGWNIREARGRDLHEVYPVKNEETGEKENNILDKIYKHGLVKELANHTILITKEGEEIPVMDTGAPIYDTDGQVIGISIAFQDETEKRKQQNLIKESEARFRLTMENILEGCQIIGFDYKYLFLNKAALSHSRKSKEELIGKTMMECYPGIETTEMFRTLKRCMEERKPDTMENIFKYPNGHERIFYLRFEPVPEGLFILSEDLTEKRKAEEKIASSEKFLSSLVNTIGDTILTILMPEREIQHVNRAVTQMFGYNESEVVGNTTKMFYLSDEDFEDYGNKVDDAIKNNKSFVKAELELIKKDGTIIYCDSHTTFLKNNESVERVITVLRDITEKKKNEEQIKLLYGAAEQSSVSIVITDPDGIIEYVNPRCSQVTGYSKEELTGQSSSIFNSGHHSNEFYDNLWKTILSGNTWKSEILNKKKNGKLHWESAVISPVKNEKNKISHFIEVKEDITERKKMFEELVEAKEKAEEMNKIKSLFFANMSHELRTPFVGIMGYAELLSESLEDTEQKEMAQGIVNTSKRMMDTLSKLLTLSKLEIHDIKIVKEEFNVRELIDTVHKEYLAAAAKKNLTFDKKVNYDSLIIESDSSLLKEILNNLVTNAINYTNRGSITISSEKQIINKKEFLRLRVSDTGIGIPKEKQDIIWNEFRQVSEGSTRNYQGTGLGLTIVKKYTEYLGGTIRLESKEGEGSTFFLELPIEQKNS